MMLLLRPGWPVFALSLVLVHGAPPVAANTTAPAASGPAALCEEAGRRAAYEAGVPLDILATVALTETGRRLDGIVRPWAWSVNSEGTGAWFDSPHQALDFARGRLAQGRTNLDIGCFQINYRWHAEAFGSVAEMFDPLTNARYAADFLRRLHAETGDWRAAAGAFHSRTPGKATAYLTRFDELRRVALKQAGQAGAPETYNRFSVATGDRIRPDDALKDEMPVPQMAARGPIDIALASGRVIGADDNFATADQPFPFGGDLGRDSRHESHRHQTLPEARTLLGVRLDETAAPRGASLAALGSVAAPMPGVARSLPENTSAPILLASTTGAGLLVRSGVGPLW